MIVMRPFCSRRSAFVLPALLLGFLLPAYPAQSAIRDGGIDPANLGKGDWVYSMTDATNKLGGHVTSVTNETSLMLFYKSQGIRYFIVKAATNDKLFNGCYPTPQFTSALVNIAHANGILIFGYNRSYGSNVVGEVAISDYIFNQGADGFVWDAEAEWESAQPWIGANGPALAWQLCSTVRAHWPTKFLAHAPFPIISYHSSFPYKEFGYFCDAVMPQIYHSGWTALKGTASGGINWSDVNWANWQRSLAGTSSVIDGATVYWTNAIKPLAPVENVYGGGGASPCEGTAAALNSKDVLEFIDYLSADPNCVTAGGYNGVNFWRADLHGSAQWANIKAGTSGTFTGRVNNIVLDDPSAATAGAWTMVRTFYNGNFYGSGSGTDTNSFGTNYLTRANGTGSAYVQFTPRIVVPGDYNVYQWHPYRPDASTNTPFVLSYNGGATTIYANQQTNSGNWSWLGKFNFLAGTGGYIRVTDAIPESGGVAIVDGVKLVFVPPTAPPSAPTNSQAASLNGNQINLSWTDTATNETGFVIARAFALAGPYSDIGSVPGNTTSFNNIGLAADTTYYYTVRATNFLGSSASSAPVSATTASPPVITNQPQPQAAVPGGTVFFQVGAASSLPLRYQWRFNSLLLTGQTAATLSLTNIQPANFGNYSALVSNDAGSVPSASAALTQAASPSILGFNLDDVSFTLSFPSEPGPDYAVEFTPTLDQPAWQVLTNIPGTGNVVSTTDSTATNPARFYRIHVR